MSCPLKAARRGRGGNQDGADSAHLAILQTHFDAVRMVGRFGEDVAHHAPGPLARALVSFEDDLDRKAGANVTAILSAHLCGVADPGLKPCSAVPQDTFPALRMLMATNVEVAMLQGIEAMGLSELVEIGKLIGAQDAGANVDSLRNRVLAWLGKLTGTAGKPLDVVERASLELVARQWGMTFEPSMATDELERTLRIKIAGDAAEYLGPSWKLACIFAAAGPVDAIEPKLRLLEKAASLAVPSQKARQALLTEWRSSCNRWSSVDEALSELRIHFKTVERAELALNLSLVIALADGRLEAGEERLFRELYEQAGKSSGEAVEALRRVSSLFWDNQAKATPKSAVDSAQADKMAALKAAELTLEGPGMLEGFVLEASDKLSEGGGVAVTPKSGWQRVLGAFSGFSAFVSSRVSTQDQATLTRIVYLAILRQHAQVVAEQSAAEKAAAARAHKPAPPVQAPIASEVGNISTARAQRVVKLDP